METKLNETRVWRALGPTARAGAAVALCAALISPAVNAADNGWLKQLERGDLGGAIEGATRALGGADKPARQAQERRPSRSVSKERRRAVVPAQAPAVRVTPKAQQAQKKQTRSIDERRSARAAKRADRDAQRARSVTVAPDPSETRARRR